MSAAGGEVFVTFGAVAAASGDAKTTSAALNQQLADLKSYLAPLVASWEGQAAVDYNAKQKQWDQAQTALNTLLAQIGTALDTSHSNYTEAENRNASMWT